MLHYRHVIAVRNKWTVFWIILTLGTTCHLNAQTVESRNGNIWIIQGDGAAMQLTTTGLDADPSLSLDRKTTIFVRKTNIQAGFNEPIDPNPVETQIWTLNLNDPPNATMVFSGPLISNGSQYATFRKPALSPNKKRAYFLIQLAVDEDGLVALDLGSKQAKVISSALEYYLIETGRGAGDVVVRKLTTEALGFSRKYWLLTPDGRDLGLVGQTKEELQAFLTNPNRTLSDSRP